MSSWISDYRQTQNYSGTGDVHILAYVECDDISDLPSVNYFTGFVLDKESIAHVINGNQKYMLNSQGVWMLQEDPLFSGIYTKSEIDEMFSDVDDIQTAQAVSIRDLQYDVEALQQADSVTDGRISKLVDQGAKNLLNVYDTQTQTINGITWTINADGTVTANGTATANSFLYLIPNNTNIAYGYETHISGCPAGGSSTTYEIQVAMTGGTTYHDYGDGQAIPSTYVYRYFVCAVRSGQTVSNLVFRPMITEAWKYALSQAFVPYSPTNAELAKMILNP